MNAPAVRPAQDFAAPARRQPPWLTYEARRARSTRSDLWPDFSPTTLAAAQAPEPLPCPGGGDCVCHDEDDWPPGIADGIAAVELELFDGPPR